MARVSFQTLGCKLNFAETSTLARSFEARGYETVPFGAPADVSVINTCTVTEQAEAKCRNAIRRAVKANEDVFVIVTGCYAQLGHEVIQRIEGVDLILGNAEKFDLFGHVDSFRKRERPQVAVSCVDDHREFGASWSESRRTRAFLKIQDGCDYSCSFCTIPLARGRSRSPHLDQILRHARDIAAKGVAEIVLTGVNIGLYGDDSGSSLLELLMRLDREVDVRRLRLSSIEPNLLTDEILEFVAGSRHVVPHFHMPLQSGDDEVLARMRRRYRREVYADRIGKIRRLFPAAAIGCDVIVGFPAETPERFENTAAFLDELDVSYLHVFTYSERPNTAAVEHLGEIDGAPVRVAERRRRSRVLRMLSDKKRSAFYRANAGRLAHVLWEREERDGKMSGWTDNYLRVSTTYSEQRTGKVEPVVLNRLDCSVPHFDV